MKPFNLLYPFPLFHSLILQMLLLKDWNSYNVGLFFPPCDGNQNKYMPFPHRTNEDSLLVPSLSIALYQKFTEFIFFFLLWTTKLEKHRLFILTKSRTAAFSQVKFKHLGKTACQPWCCWKPVREVQLGQASIKWLNGDWTLTETVCCSCDTCTRNKS